MDARAKKRVEKYLTTSSQRANKKSMEHIVKQMPDETKQNLTKKHNGKQ